MKHMANTTHQETNPNEAELHRWFVQWVLGKNRGVEAPLDPHKLVMLLKYNLVNNNQLNEVELSQLPPENDQDDVLCITHQKKDEINFSDVVISGMEIMIKKMVDEDLGKIENSQRLSQEMLSKLYYDRFTYEYGVDSESLRQIIEDNQRKTQHA
jgi:hypothetical protein